MVVVLPIELGTRGTDPLFMPFSQEDNRSFMVAQRPDLPALLRRLSTSSFAGRLRAVSRTEITNCRRAQALLSGITFRPSVLLDRARFLLRHDGHGQLRRDDAVGRIHRGDLDAIAHLLAGGGRRTRCVACMMLRATISTCS